jgi:hypothetical protein
MKRKAVRVFSYYFIRITLLIVIFSLLDPSVYWKQLPIDKKTTIHQTTFELLDFQQCDKQCTQVSLCRNLYLLSVNSFNDSSMWVFMKKLEPLNGCRTVLLIQKRNSIEPNWKQIFQVPLAKVDYPDHYIAICYLDVGRFIISNLANGKLNGKSGMYYLDGRLDFEEEWVNNKREGKRIIYGKETYIQTWKDDQLISEYTINKKDSL